MISYQITVSEPKAPGWSRAARIGLGVIAIVLAIVFMASPAITIASVVFILGIVLLIVGIESVISGIVIKSKSRWASIGLGIIVIILASIVIAFPLGTAAFLIILLGIALLIDGIARVIHGFGDKTSRGWSRGFRIGVGALEIAVGISVFWLPFGFALVGFIIAIALLIAGIEMVVAGISGRKMSMLPTSGFKKG
jgi:uncharacterized membrane protein HdeD (DUF308 family)